MKEREREKERVREKEGVQFLFFWASMDLFHPNTFIQRLSFIKNISSKKNEMPKGSMWSSVPLPQLSLNVCSYVVIGAAAPKGAMSC